MKNNMTVEEIEKRREELRQDIQYVDRNLLGISSLIIKEIRSIDILKNGINLYKIDGINIDRKNNSAVVSDLETFERQLTRKVEETIDSISTKSGFVKKLTDEHTRISAIKASLEAELNSLPASPKAKTTASQKSLTGSKLGFDLNTKK